MKKTIRNKIVKVNPKQKTNAFLLCEENSLKVYYSQEFESFILLLGRKNIAVPKNNSFSKHIMNFVCSKGEKHDK